MPTHSPLCAFCGAQPTTESLIVGRNGAMCWPCAGEAFRAVANSPRLSPQEVTDLDASRRCLMCDSGSSDWRMVVFRPPFCLCTECLQTAFKICARQEEVSLLAIRF